MTEEEKERLVLEFRACLDLMETNGIPPGSGEEEGTLPPDLRTLLTEMALLKNEVRLESRQSKVLLQELRNFANLLKEEKERLLAELERAREQTSSARRQTEREMLLGVLDLRDRLESGAETVLSRGSGPIARLLAKREIRHFESLVQGLTLTLRRTDDFLARYRVRPLACVGLSLDPATMRAVVAEEVPGLPEGVVVREIRKGFVIDGALLRTAEVVVNKTRKEEGRWKS